MTNDKTIEWYENEIARLQKLVSECETKRLLQIEEFQKQLEELKHQINIANVNECVEAEFLKEIIIDLLDNKKDEVIKKLLDFVV